MLKRLKGFSGIVICTGNVAHTMVEGTVRMRKQMGSLSPGRTLAAYPP